MITRETAYTPVDEKPRDSHRKTIFPCWKRSLLEVPKFDCPQKVLNVLLLYPIMSSCELAMRFKLFHVALSDL